MITFNFQTTTFKLSLFVSIPELISPSILSQRWRWVVRFTSMFDIMYAQNSLAASPPRNRFESEGLDKRHTRTEFYFTTWWASSLIMAKILVTRVWNTTRIDFRHVLRRKGPLKVFYIVITVFLDGIFQICNGPIFVDALGFRETVFICRRNRPFEESWCEIFIVIIQFE